MSPAPFFCYARRMSTLRIALALILVSPLLMSAQANLTGKWNSKFPTQVGDQEYAFDLVAKGTSLTGTMKSNLLGETKVEDGKIDGQKFTFTENASFMEVPLRITYACAVSSADEFKCTRNVADAGMEELIAKRAK